MPGDASYASVSVLLHGDGTNGSTTITDNGPAARTFTAGGNAQISTTQSKWGGASIKLDGTGDYVQCPASTDFALPGDFTIEFWAWKSANGSGNYDTALTTDTTNGYVINAWQVELSASRGLVLIVGGATIFTYATNPNDSAWHHWALSRTGSALTAYKDGTQVYSGTYSGSMLADGAFGVGGSAVSTTYPFNGYIDDARVTKGVGRYPAAFTAPTAAFPDSSSGVEAYAAAASPLGAPAVLAESLAALAAAPTMLGTPAVLGFQQFAIAAAPSPLGSPGTLAYHDFTGQLGDAITRYVMDLTTPGGLVRVPISSWQATLQTGASNYVQCVIPAAADWSASIDAATAFTISRTAEPPGLPVIEYEMASAPLETVSVAQGQTNFTATLSGYSPAFAVDDAPPTAKNRTLAGVRSVTTTGGKVRVRCAIDWLLRPAMRAYLPDGSSFVVGYINYYQPQGFDSYMDVGE